jgi:hypothetical protein
LSQVSSGEVGTLNAFVDFLLDPGRVTYYREASPFSGGCMRTFVVSIALVIAFVCTAQITNRAPQVAPAMQTERPCAPLGLPFLRTTLYFGLARPAGSVSEGQWRSFLREEVSPRFPQGLTVWEADGQWRQPDGRIGRERAKVLLLVHEDTPEVRKSLAALVGRYKSLFQQESVLWETAPVCAAF